MFCGTIVKQVGDSFCLSNKDHCHSGTPGQLAVTTVTSQVKRAALDQPFKPASHIVSGVLVNNVTDVPASSLPKASSLARTADRVRQRQLPQDPVDLNFVLLHDAVPQSKSNRGILLNALTQW